MKKQGLIWLMFSLMFAAQAQTKIELAGGVTGKRFSLKMDWGNLNYEIFGEGDPLLILHGNGGSVEGKYAMIPSLLEHYQVIAIDSRCHGRSGCPDGDLDYFQMAEDVHAVMKVLAHKKYSIWGHSDGGILGLIIGYRYTSEVDRMLISGANTRLSGLKPELVAMMSNYQQIPDATTKKHLALMVNQKEIPMDSLRKINVPVMLMVGDRDAVRMQHTMEIFEALPMSNLCVLPATTHFIGNDRLHHIIYWLKEFKKPFSAPSTIEVANAMAESLMGN
ncbi:alpha/beta hydrolase [Roseivirga sp. UBA1976]|uniref:alpha/beta fold hydrolase n=1 Tax=Roseivirga sp. UBA1976 TaxID=1947386 RepID=UPI00257D0F1F|nr:alpha/beta hydrolase [Roseivirga sp. UBA1976]|tara:strand:- start:6743 stop:7573 length:831 start_codon:yes stop_codon:yes gene_type:complete